MRLRLLFAAAFMAALVGLHTQHASAHVLAENDGVTVVLHVPPYDAPQAGDATTLKFEFGTDTGGFHISDYHVTVVAASPGIPTITQPVVAPFFGASGVGTATVHFPKGAVYSLTLTGKPLSPSDPSFVTKYTLRVTPGKTAAGNGTGQSNTGALQTALISIAVFVIFLMVAARQVIAGKRYTGSTKPHVK